MRRARLRILAGIVCAVTCAIAVQSDEATFQAGIQKEVVDGDLAGAIKFYEAAAKSTNRPLAVKALLRMAQCYEKTSDPRALQIYERIAREFSDQKAAAQQAFARLALLTPVAKSGAVVGWYNGDWQSGLPGLANWFVSPAESARVYDDFVVPEGGWTVAAVFSNNRMDFSGVTYAAWEIRAEMAPGRGGRKVAAGLSPATQTVIPGTGPFEHDPLVGYRIQVDGLHLRLAPGRYWLSVAPVGMGNSWISATLGRNAVGEPPGNDGRALFSGHTVSGFVAAERVGRAGANGVSKDFSLGVVILKDK